MELGSKLKAIAKEPPALESEAKVKSYKKAIWKIANHIALPIIILVAWEAASKSGLFTPILMPSLETLGRTFMDGLRSGQIMTDLSYSMARVLKGYGFGIVLGISMGILMGIFARVNVFFSATFNAIRQIPSLAWIPLLILWFGIGETSKIILIAKSSFFPILLNTIEGVRSLAPGYVELAQLYKIRKKDLIMKLYIPSALPSIFTGLRLGASTAWIAVVASELIVATSGIGYRISDARNFMQSDVVVVNMVVIGLIGVGMDFLLRWIEKLLPFGKYRNLKG